MNEADLENILTYVLNQFLDHMITRTEEFMPASSTTGPRVSYVCGICGRAHSKKRRADRHLLSKHNHQFLEYTMNMAEELSRAATIDERVLVDHLTAQIMGINVPDAGYDDADEFALGLDLDSMDVTDIDTPGLRESARLRSTWLCENCGFNCKSQEELQSHVTMFHPFG